ncbi:ABC transporter ATP-binding protein/permease [Streptomyces coffeae]|uniref:ABC transporter ATP-binding protein/permease n=1 Tax=Streptomyces coffeae TaxID=621382 RepID=UPI003557E2B4
MGVFYGIVHVLSQALVPAVIGRAIDTGIIAENQRALLLWGGAVVALGVIQAAAGILRDRAALTTRLGASYRTAQHITRQAAGLGASLPGRATKGEVVNAGVADLSQLGDALAETARGGSAVIAVGMVAAILLTTSWQLGLVVLIGVPLMAGAIALLIRPLHRRRQRLREQQAELTGRAVDIVGGLRVLRGIGGEESVAARYRADSQRVRAAGVAVARVEALFDAAKVLLPGLLTTVVVWLGAHYVATGRIGAGQLVAFYGYAVYLADPLRRITGAVSKLTGGHVAARRVVRFLALRPALESGSADPGPDGGPAALADPASGLTVAPGRLTAVVCASSADATTLAERLGRYTDSAVTLGDLPLSDLPLAEVRRRILVADNDDRLFAGPLRAELRGEHGSDDLLERAVDAASAQDIVAALPHGLDDTVTACGGTFSGGQQQRLRLVRALVADPEVLIHVQQLLGPVDMLLYSLGDLQAGAASLARLLGVHRGPEPAAGHATASAPRHRALALRGVTYAYPGGEDVLRGIDLDIEPGERLAVVGPSGAGKSTLGRLLAGIEAPRTGAVTVGGIPLTGLPPHELRGQVALVTQESYVFRGTLRENLLLARPGADDRELERALDVVGALGWAEETGLDTRVGAGGTVLPPDRVQQLSLARLVLADPHTLVLDEATSLLDPRAARRLERSMAAVLQGRTVIAIAHRLHTAHDADRVAVMERGRITELGPHEELVGREGAYAALWESWHGRS